MLFAFINQDKVEIRNKVLAIIHALVMIDWKSERNYRHQNATNSISRPSNSWPTPLLRDLVRVLTHGYLILSIYSLYSKLLPKIP